MCLSLKAGAGCNTNLYDVLTVMPLPPHIFICSAEALTKDIIDHNTNGLHQTGWASSVNATN